MRFAPQLTSAFRLISHASDGVLTARWLPPLTVRPLPGTYADPLTAASHHPQRRFWLFDLRGCDPATDAAGKWFADAFAVRTFCTPGLPVYVAYVFDDDHPAVTGAVAATTQQTYLAYGICVGCFVQEAAARAWLRRQQGGSRQPAPAQA